MVIGKTGDSLIGNMIYSEMMKSEFFEEWFREIFLKDIEKLRKNVLILMDNARFHRKSILEKMIEETGIVYYFFRRIHQI